MGSRFTKKQASEGMKHLTDSKWLAAQSENASEPAKPAPEAAKKLYSLLHSEVARCIKAQVALFDDRALTGGNGQARLLEMAYRRGVANTASAELLCALGKRVPRFYLP